MVTTVVVVVVVVMGVMLDPVNTVNPLQGMLFRFQTCLLE